MKKETKLNKKETEFISNFLEKVKKIQSITDIYNMIYFSTNYTLKTIKENLEKIEKQTENLRNFLDLNENILNIKIFKIILKEINDKNLYFNNKNHNKLLVFYKINKKNYNIELKKIISFLFDYINKFDNDFQNVILNWNRKNLTYT